MAVLAADCWTPRELETKGGGLHSVRLWDWVRYAARVYEAPFRVAGAENRWFARDGCRDNRLLEERCQRERCPLVGL